MKVTSERAFAAGILRLFEGGGSAAVVLSMGADRGYFASTTFKTRDPSNHELHTISIRNAPEMACVTVSIALILGILLYRFGVSSRLLHLKLKAKHADWLSVDKRGGLSPSDPQTGQLYWPVFLGFLGFLAYDHAGAVVMFWFIFLSLYFFRPSSLEEVNSQTHARRLRRQFLWFFSYESLTPLVAVTVVANIDGTFRATSVDGAGNQLAPSSPADSWKTLQEAEQDASDWSGLLNLPVQDSKKQRHRAI